ncbi:MAG: hypothetical protein ACLU9S_10665 [Oscillospiraceae bacterium]
MDPFDKTQTDPIWQRVWNRPTATGAAPTASIPGTRAASAAASAKKQLRPPSAASSTTAAPHPGDVLDSPGTSAATIPGGEGARLDAECQMLGRSLGPGGTDRHEPSAPSGHGASSACLRGMARPEQGGRMTPQPEPPPGAGERTLLRLLTQARQFENMYATARTIPSMVRFFLSSARRWCRPSGFCSFCWEAKNR